MNGLPPAPGAVHNILPVFSIPSLISRKKNPLIIFNHNQLKQIKEKRCFSGVTVLHYLREGLFRENAISIVLLKVQRLNCLREHSYMTSDFWVGSQVKHLMRVGRQVKNAQKTSDVIYECSLSLHSYILRDHPYMYYVSKEVGGGGQMVIFPYSIY